MPNRTWTLGSAPALIVMLALALLLPATAHAELYSGQVFDPRGDGISTYNYADDLRTFSVSHDTDNARLRFSLRFWDTDTPDPDQDYYRFFVVDAGLGAYQNNACNVGATLSYTQDDSGEDAPPLFVWGRRAWNGTVEQADSGGKWLGADV